MAAHNLKIEAAFATLPLPGQSESGDLSFVKRVGKGTLIAVVDGLGHGQDAASAAHAAVGALDRYSREPLIELVRRCHDALVGLRGVVLGLAYLDPQAATMTWLGVGNVGGVLLRVDLGNRPSRITLVPNAGFIGAEQPGREVRMTERGDVGRHAHDAKHRARHCPPDDADGQAGTERIRHRGRGGSRGAIGKPFAVTPRRDRNQSDLHHLAETERDPDVEPRGGHGRQGDWPDEAAHPDAVDQIEGEVARHHRDGGRGEPQDDGPQRAGRQRAGDLLSGRSVLPVRARHRCPSGAG